MLHALGLVVFELDMQAILDADFHLDRVVAIWRHTERVYPDVALFDDVCYSPRYSHAYKVPELDVDALVTLVLLLDVLEKEVECLRLSHLPRRRELLRER